MARHDAPQPHTPQSPPVPRSAPAPLTAAWLRAHFDPLPFPARMSALARYARTLAPHAYAALHRTLDAGTSDERHTALFLAVARRDLTAVATALTDPQLRRRALAAAIRLPVDTKALEQLALSPVAATRHETYRVLRLSRRDTLAGQLLPTVHDRFGAREAALLLPACPTETVAAWLPRLDPPQGVLHTLARTAPVAVARLMAARLQQATDHHHRHRLTRGYRAPASLAARRDPEAALLLLRAEPALLTGAAIRTLLRHPAQMLDALRAAPPDSDGSPREVALPAGPLPSAARRALRTLPPADLAELAGRCPAARARRGGQGRVDITPDGLLALLPSPERGRLVAQRTARSRAVHGIPLSTLAALDPADRTRVVRPLLERSRRDLAVCRLATVLPLTEGEPLLRALTERHRSHLRAMAWPALLACAELEGDPDEFARVATDCERAWHDQDEVRRAALEQLAGAPARLLAALPDRVLRDAALTTVQSRDSTSRTLGAAETLLRRVAHLAAVGGSQSRAAHAVELLCEVVCDPRSRSDGPVRPLDLDESTARALWNAASPHTRAGAETRICLAELLAPHLAALPELDALVRQTALDGDDPALSARAAAAWVAPADVREQRAAELIGTDASFATVPLILRTATTRRTDLMDGILTAAQHGLKGCVRPRPTPWTPRLRPATTGRWLPEQRLAWDQHHASVAQDGQAALRTRADAVAYLHDTRLLADLADSAPQPVAAAALIALGSATGTRRAHRTTAHDSATPEQEPLRDLLLRHAATGGVRGRAAMTALRGLLDTLPDREAVALLTPVACAPGTPVGSRKEAARALGTLTGEAPVAALVAAWDAPGQHRDVHAVVARLLLAVIDRPEIADRLTRGVTDAAGRDAVIHARVGPVPDSAAAAYRPFLARLVREGDDDTVVAACRALPGWLTPDSGDAMRAMADLVVDPGRGRRLWSVAAQGLAHFPPGPVGECVLKDVFRALQERAGEQDPQGRADALRRLAGVAGAPRVQRGPAGALPAADALAATLHTVGLTREATRLLWEASLSALRHGQYDPARWEKLLLLVEERPDRLPQGPDLYLDIDGPRAREALLAAARMLRERGTPVAGVMALALVSAAGRAISWEQPWRDELSALCDHEDADTAMAALLVEAKPR
ncbi:hypothetical protein GCM10010252_61280 [Streptomyces aureoverticillatus]|nr:hypothetical protein GCM10010252_61280 [Streptomyces aureoverticillatus]